MSKIKGKRSGVRSDPFYSSRDYQIWNIPNAILHDREYFDKYYKRVKGYYTPVEDTRTIGVKREPYINDYE